MNNTEHGSQPIKNEQSGSAQTWSLIASKVINSINVPNVDKDPNGAIEAMESLHRMNELISVISNIELSITRILTATKVSTVDEVISKIERYDPLESQVVELLGVSKCKNVLEVVQMLARHPLSPEDIKRAAQEYADNEYLNNKDSVYPNDYKGFTEGANFAKQPLSNESNNDNQDEDDDDFNDDPYDYYQCMSCGNVQQSSITCGKCCGPLSGQYL